MTSPKNRRLYRYIYDPLDRLLSCGAEQAVMTQRFYNNKRLSTQIQGALKDSVFQAHGCLLAQQRQHAPDETALLATDTPGSVLNVLSAQRHKGVAYSPYGHRAAEVEGAALLGFNGECADLVTGHYLLGNGYRAFNPVLMRFNSPDSFSPFGAGGINAYGYCAGDPVNRSDEDGHAWSFWGAVRKRWAAVFEAPRHSSYNHPLYLTEEMKAWQAVSEPYRKIGEKRKALNYIAKDEKRYLSRRKKAASERRDLKPEWEVAKKNMLADVNAESPFAKGAAVVSSDKSKKLVLDRVVRVQTFESDHYVGVGLSGELLKPIRGRKPIPISVEQFELNLKLVEERIRQSK